MKDSNFELRMGAKTWRLEDVEAPASGRVDGVDVLMLLLCEIMTASQEIYCDAWWFVIVTAKGKLTVLLWRYSSVRADGKKGVKTL